MNNSEGPCSSREETIGTQNEMTESMRIAEALQMQMEVQKKLYEQIERHLQLKIEAQGKYLQSVLHKAQETLAGMINNGSPGSPPILELTETRGGFS
ncbi:myb family transcription factor PHL8-like isoform X3 [Arachis hypogaea]